MKKRARLQLTTAILPVRPIPNTTDDAKATRIYIGRGASDPGRTFMERISTLADGVRTATLTSVTLPAGAATSPPPASSDFPASSPGRIISADGSTLLLQGDGSFDIGRHHRDPSGTEWITDTSWTNVSSFSNSWVNFGSGVRVAGYRKLLNGTVEIRGMVKSGSVAQIFALPSTYWPTAQEAFLVHAGTSGFARVEVYPSGSVALTGYGTGGSNTLVSLSGIYFDSVG
jgi:hypothetical protein